MRPNEDRTHSERRVRVVMGPLSSRSFRMRRSSRYPLGLRRRMMAKVLSMPHSHRLPVDVRPGIAGVSIGSNDPTVRELGVDRDWPEPFDEPDPAVLDDISRNVAMTRCRGITASHCGLAPSQNPPRAEHLVCRITSLPVNRHPVGAARRAVEGAKRKLLVGARFGAAREREL